MTMFGIIGIVGRVTSNSVGVLRDPRGDKMVQVKGDCPVGDSLVSAQRIIILINGG